MLKIKFELDTETLCFFCPNCGSSDLLYTTMPSACYNCREVYQFNVADLANNQYARYQYYKQRRGDT